MDKNYLKSIIRMRQEEFPANLIERDSPLPLNSNKIITVPGVRRCGKSSRMELAVNALLKQGVEKDKILWVGFDDERLIKTPADELHQIIEAYRELFPDTDFRDVYIFFDEIQLIKDWEYFVMKIFKHYSKNIFITGSNATMLSTELTSALRGWPLEELTTPLSFREYCHFKDIDCNSWLEQDIAKIKTAFIDYNNEGGFPEIALMDNHFMKVRTLQSYFETMLLRDLAEHYCISNTESLRYFLKRIMTTLTKPVSIRSLHNDLKATGLKASKDDLYDWADYAVKIFLFYRILNFDRSMQKSESSIPKYYCVDNGLRDSVLIPQSNDDGKKLENSVFLHLLRGLSASGKLFYYKGKSECDFVVQEGIEVTQLVQVAWEVTDKETLEREIDGLKEASKATGCNNLSIITYDTEEEIRLGGTETIRVVPAWKFFLGR